MPGRRMTDTDWATLADRLADMARNGPTSTWRDDVRDAAIELERLDAWGCASSPTRSPTP